MFVHPQSFQYMHIARKCSIQSINVISLLGHTRTRGIVLQTRYIFFFSFIPQWRYCLILSKESIFSYKLCFIINRSLLSNIPCSAILLYNMSTRYFFFLSSCKYLRKNRNSGNGKKKAIFYRCVLKVSEVLTIQHYFIFFQISTSKYNEIIKTTTIL